MLNNQIDWNDLFQRMSEIYTGILVCVDDKKHIYRAYARIPDRGPIKDYEDSITFSLVSGPMDLVGIPIDGNLIYVTCNPRAILTLVTGWFNHMNN
jgi:hypothetical protein